MAAALLVALAGPAVADPVTIVTPETTLSLEATVEEGEVWISADDLSQVNGFALKPEGVCLGDDLCVPLPAKEEEWVRRGKAGTSFNLTAFAGELGQAVAADAEQKVWSFGELELAGGLASGKAPDFELKDIDGQTVRLSDFRGKKVMLWIWASW